MQIDGSALVRKRRNLRHNAPDRDPVEHAEGPMHGDALWPWIIGEDRTDAHEIEQAAAMAPPYASSSTSSFA
jgi:hypothetical protein